MWQNKHSLMLEVPNDTKWDLKVSYLIKDYNLTEVSSMLMSKH